MKQKKTFGVDCVCNKLFYYKDYLEKHEKEHTLKCGICGAWMNFESPELRYCVSEGHLEGPYFDQYLENVIYGFMEV